MIFIAFANFPRSLLAAPLLFPVLLAACSPQNAEQETAATASQEIAASEKGKADGESPAPREFAGTAWRSIAGDGARYTTFIDAGELIATCAMASRSSRARGPGMPTGKAGCYASCQMQKVGWSVAGVSRHSKRV